jgi:hypothetical protein
MFKNLFFRQSCSLRDNVEAYGTVRQATDNNIIGRMRLAGWITKATDTRNMYYSLLFHGKNGYANVRQCYVISTLAVLLNAIR